MKRWRVTYRCGECDVDVWRDMKMKMLGVRRRCRERGVDVESMM